MLKLENPNLSTRALIVCGRMIKVLGAGHVIVKATERTLDSSLHNIIIQTEYGRAEIINPKPERNYVLMVSRDMKGVLKLRPRDMTPKEYEMYKNEAVHTPRNLISGCWAEYYSNGDHFGDTFRNMQVHLKPRHPNNGF